MGGCFSKKKTSNSGYNAYRSAPEVGGGRVGGGYDNYRRPHEPIVPRPPATSTTHQPRYSPEKPQSVASPVAPKPVQSADPNTILGKAFEDVRSHYSLGKELGRGQFGVTYLCREISTGKAYACKSISKRKLVSKNDKEDIKREIQIMQHLSGQPNIVEFRGAYEDRQSVNLVMELCAGGELFDRIIAKGHYSERAAATICRAIVNVVHACHFMGVMHRDLKPENFLLSSKSENAVLKATDFGLSVFIEEGKENSIIKMDSQLLLDNLIMDSLGCLPEPGLPFIQVCCCRFDKTPPCYSQILETCLVN